MLAWPSCRSRMRRKRPVATVNSRSYGAGSEVKSGAGDRPSLRFQSSPFGLYFHRAASRHLCKTPSQALQANPHGVSQLSARPGDARGYPPEVWIYRQSGRGRTLAYRCAVPKGPGRSGPDDAEDQDPSTEERVLRRDEHRFLPAGKISGTDSASADAFRILYLP